MNRTTVIISGVLTVLVAWFAWQAQRNASELRTRLLVSDARVELLTNDADAALPLALADAPALPEPAPSPDYTHAQAAQDRANGFRLPEMQ